MTIQGEDGSTQVSSTGFFSGPTSWHRVKPQDQTESRLLLHKSMTNTSLTEAWVLLLRGSQRLIHQPVTTAIQKWKVKRYNCSINRSINQNSSQRAAKTYYFLYTAFGLLHLFLISPFRSSYLTTVDLKRQVFCTGIWASCCKELEHQLPEHLISHAQW